MRTIIAAITNTQSRRADRQGINFVAESTTRGLDLASVVVRGFLVRVGSMFALPMCAHLAPATVCQHKRHERKGWQGGLGMNTSLGRLPLGGSGYPAGTGRYHAG